MPNFLLIQLTNCLIIPLSSFSKTSCISCSDNKLPYLTKWLQFRSMCFFWGWYETRKSIPYRYQPFRGNKSYQPLNRYQYSSKIYRKKIPGCTSLFWLYWLVFGILASMIKNWKKKLKNILFNLIYWLMYLN